MTIPDGVGRLELYTAPDTGQPYLEVSWGRTRLLARYAPDELTQVDGGWAAQHPQIVTDQTLAACRIGGASFDAVPAVVGDLGPANAGLAWPSPVVLGREIATQHDILLDPERAAWAVVPRSRA